MYENWEEINYNVLFCHACLSSNGTLCAVGDYLDIYLKICDNSRMNLTSQVNVCCECMALLKQVHAFKKKVENAQRFLDFCVAKQVPLEENLSDFTLFSSETATLDYYPIIEREHADEYVQDELMIRIEDVRGRCDITDVRPTLDLSTSSCDAPAPPTPGCPEDEERRHCQWKRTALLVYNRICSHRYAHHFLKPVSDERAPLYSRIVRRPTDLSTIKRRIKDGGIRTTAELTRALLLMFCNAMMYNSSCHKIHKMTLEFREETIRELSFLQEALALRRPYVRECPAPVSPVSPVSPAPAARVRRASLWVASQRLAPPPPLTRRRKSMWDASQEARECPPLVPPAAPPAAPAPAPASAPAPLLKPPQPLARRRKSMWDGSQEDVSKPAVLVRARRKTVCRPAEPPRRRARCPWRGLDTEYLVASCFKKCKSTVLL